MGAQSDRLWNRRVLPVVILFALVVHSASASSIHWAEGLTPGPYPVGFETVEQFDLSRAYGPAVDYYGNPLSRDLERPIQIYVWYPAQPGVDLPRMVYGEYNFAYPDDDLFMEFLSVLQNREIALLQRLTRGDQGLVLDLLSVGVHATRDAPPDTGRFPLILYAPGAGHGVAENAVLCEHLASHGFVVAGAASLGAMSTQPELTPRDLDAQLRDVQFILGQLIHDGRVDPAHIGVAGTGQGAAAAMLTAMSDARIDAVAVLGPTHDMAGHMSGSPAFDPDRLRAAALYLDSAVHATGGDFPYADRFELTAELAPLSGPTHYAWIAALAADSTGEDTRTAAGALNGVCEYTSFFFEAALAGDIDLQLVLREWEQLPGGGQVTYSPAEEAPPSGDQLRGILQEQGAEAAAELFYRFELARAQPPIFDQGYLNGVGYRLLGSGRAEAAIIVFRMCTEIYPGSANAWDSYGDGLEQAGRIDEAVASYRKVLETIPADSTASPRLLQQLREHAEEAIPRLEGTTNQ